MDSLLKNEKFARADKIQLVNVVMPALDAPESLRRQAAASAKGNAYGSVE